MNFDLAVLDHVLLTSHANEVHKGCSGANLGCSACVNLSRDTRAKRSASAARRLGSSS